MTDTEEAALPVSPRSGRFPRTPQCAKEAFVLLSPHVRDD